MCRNIWRWTDMATGRKTQFHGFVLWRFERDKIAERWATVTPPTEGSMWLTLEVALAGEKTTEWSSFHDRVSRGCQ